MLYRARKMVSVFAASAAALALGACDVEQTEEGEMPEIEVEGGNMPEYNVDAPDVDVTTEERTVEVPVIDVEPADASEEPAAERE
ncbi:hypothetical protein U4960_12210 [Altererythrobacter sp. H2]|uniref:hypothetical protein n=1 Tax=Altererythrobacter sp. H2 TaxID=3108391 RepID=UPI002B4BF594|nr:hypothetical protein [Altererythrobacter sp. H2]WRK95051.1 hypothetical protein U4960_12210 [Altererythrobacter sp. H2]